MGQVREVLGFFDVDDTDEASLLHRTVRHCHLINILVRVFIYIN